jgi:phage baseplate assembly protein W
MSSNQNGLVEQQRITRRPYFVGFNTVGQRTPPFSLTNIEVIKRDLYNHFATPMGSRLMLPNFGTKIHDYLFDPFDDFTKTAIIEDAIRVVQSDPRVQLVAVDVFEEDQALTVAIDLMFLPESVTDSLFVRFSQKDKEEF